MNGAQHYIEAERLLDQAHIPARDRAVPNWLTPDELVAEAQVHATLAGAAATVDAGPDGLDNGPDWRQATS